MRLYLPVLLLLLMAVFNLPAQEAPTELGLQEFITSIYFATASAELDEEAQSQLQTLIEKVRGMGDYRLELAAHTDSRGTSRYNDRLAQSRASSVTQFLESSYVTTDGMRALAFGESQAGDDLGSEEKQRDNRRVDVIISGWYWQGINNLRDSLSQPHQQRFTVNTDQDHLLAGNKGGRFYLSANSFQTADGQEVSGEVTIELTECYTLGDMVSLGLTTTAQDRILESGGMLKIDAYQNGKALQLKPGSTIAVSVPTPQYRDNMSVFYGLAHEEENASIDWEDSEEEVSSELPRLRLARAPSRPSHSYFSARYFKEQVSEDQDPRLPKGPGKTKPMRPRKPNYDKIAYHPKGLQKIFMGQATKGERTAELKEERRISYEEAIKSYEERIANYNIQLAKHRIAMEEFRALRSAEVDDEGFIKVGPAYEFLQSQADSAYTMAMIKYRRDSTAYQGYRRKKTADYERQLEALGQVDAGIVKSYFMSINQLGWANIDRFLKTVPNTPLAVRELGTATDPTAMVFLMIPSRNIILPMRYDHLESFVLSRVPLGEKAKILAIKIKDQKAYLASQEIIITDDLMLTLDYRPGRLRDIREELAGL